MLNITHFTNSIRSFIYFNYKINLVLIFLHFLTLFKEIMKGKQPNLKRDLNKGKIYFPMLFMILLHHKQKLETKKIDLINFGVSET